MGPKWVIDFDKTGTPTEGRLAVTDVISPNGPTEHEVVQIAASLGVKSTQRLLTATPKKSFWDRIRGRRIRGH